MRTMLIVAALLAGPAIPAAAQTATLPEHMAKMDADKDGRVSLAEFTADRAKALKTLDADRNGTVSKDEATAYYVKIAPAEDPRTVKRIADVTMADKDGNGTSLAEMEAARAESFRKRDRNGDGFITADEA